MENRILGGVGVEILPAELASMGQKARLLKVLAHPVRLCIARGLGRTGRCNVTKIQTCLELPQSTISQHLMRLREAGVLAAERSGVEVFYRLANKEAEAVVRALFPEEDTAGDTAPDPQK